MFQHAPTYNSYLTTMAQAATADEAESIAGFLFPKIKVDTAIGAYKKRDIDSAFRAYNTKLARGGKPTQLRVNAEDAYYNCKPHALEVSNWQFDLDQNGGDDWREDNLQELMSAQLVTRELEAVEIFRKSVAATAGAGAWADGQGDVIAELDDAIMTVHRAIGRMPNRCAIGLSAWAVIKNHPSVLKRFAGIEIPITAPRFLETLIFQNIDLRVGSIPFQPAKQGKTGDKKEILGGDIILFYGQDAPTRNDMSAGKDFTLDDSGPEMHTITNEDEMVTKDRLYWSTDRQVTCPAAAVRISVS